MIRKSEEKDGLGGPGGLEGFCRRVIGAGNNEVKEREKKQRKSLVKKLMDFFFIKLDDFGYFLGRISFGEQFSCGF